MTKIKVKRPDGKIEEILKDMIVTKELFLKMKEATKTAGKGELISYEVLPFAGCGEAEGLGEVRGYDSAEAATRRLAKKGYGFEGEGNF